MNNKFYNKCRVWILFLIIFCAAFISTANAEDTESIAIITSSNISQYSDALLGFEGELTRSRENASIRVFDRMHYKNLDNQLITEIRDYNPTLIYSIGTHNSLLMKKSFTDIPIIFSMVLDPVEAKLVKSMPISNENITGVTLHINIEKQFKKLKEALPHIKTIGILFDLNHSENLKLEAQRAANNLGLEVYAVGINKVSQVPKALKKVISNADCLWAGIDTHIYNRNTIEHIILTTLQYRKPFMVFSSNWVKSGALMGMECDYIDIGRQSGVMAVEALAGSKLENMPIQEPSKLNTITNPVTAETIKVNLP